MSNEIRQSSREATTEATDPICGMTVAVAPTILNFEVGAEKFYFCSQSCLTKFRNKHTQNKEMTPEGAVPVGAVTETVESGSERLAVAGFRRYTCPMHPQVVSDKLGTCPICGMSLEALEVASSDDDGAEQNELADWRTRFFFSLLFTVPLLTLEMLAEKDLLPPALQAHLNLIELVLATPVLFWSGWPIWKATWQATINRTANMFTLISLGTGAAYFYSLAIVIVPQAFPSAASAMPGHPIPTYFESAAVVTALVLLGQLLERYARRQTGNAIRSLLGLAPKTARRVKANGSEEDVPVDSIGKEDRLRVRPGEKIPADGIVLEGESYIDESMITGEPIPIAKAANDPVIAGTVNGAGSILIVAQKIGQDTLLSQIVQAASQAQRSRVPIQRLVDTVSQYFIPAVLVIATITFAVWLNFNPSHSFSTALSNAIAVLIIACPCALGLATPMSILVATGRGASEGVLIKNAEALQKLAAVNTIVIDKTGTLTEGKPSLTAVKTAADWSSDQVLQIAGSLENQSEHPIAHAILKECLTKGITLQPISAYQAVAGQGATAMVANQRIQIGNAAYLLDESTGAIPFVAEAQKLADSGQTIVFLKINDQVAAAFALTDRPKPEAKEIIADLIKENLRLIVLSGDSAAATKSICEQVGIKEYFGQCSPFDKAEHIKRLQKEGANVAMAGDGINDALALSSANVGIAMGSGTDVAIASADLILIKGDLKGLKRALKLSRDMMANIRQNLALAFLYNTLAIPVAAGALYPSFGLTLSPMVASGAMSLSSVSVIVNALRLRSSR
jgi:P-type Cu+ transporter